MRFKLDLNFNELVKPHVHHRLFNFLFEHKKRRTRSRRDVQTEVVLEGGSI